MKKASLKEEFIGNWKWLAFSASFVIFKLILNFIDFGMYGNELELLFRIMYGAYLTGVVKLTKYNSPILRYAYIAPFFIAELIDDVHCYLTYWRYESLYIFTLDIMTSIFEFLCVFAIMAYAKFLKNKIGCRCTTKLILLCCGIISVLKITYYTLVNIFSDYQYGFMNQGLFEFYKAVIRYGLLLFVGVGIATYAFNKSRYRKLSE